jgi:hypothetical protein
MWPRSARFADALGIANEGGKLDPAIVANALGRGPYALDAHVDVPFALYDVRAASKPWEHDADLVIEDECRPAHVPEFEGARVFLLGPSVGKRRGLAHREFARLRATFDVEATLAGSAVHELLSRMRKPVVGA